jgi:hypothetical protein
MLNALDHNFSFFIRQAEIKVCFARTNRLGSDVKIFPGLRVTSFTISNPQPLS